MKILRTSLSSFDPKTDLIVAIDVLRAYTTASYFFSIGVREIILVANIEEAFKLREAMPDCLISGEVNGIKVPGFDLGNSPSVAVTQNLAGKRIIQRTSAGTQVVSFESTARFVLAASLTNLSATVRAIQKAAPGTVTLLQTGYIPEEGWGDEDVACAEAIEQKLTGHAVDWAKIVERVRSSRSGLHFDGTCPDFPQEDLEMALRIDCFDFAMRIEKHDNLSILRSAPV
ncbi:MAG: 2-phosphosulfolactate phosphatase [Bellilinea sp.]